MSAIINYRLCKVFDKWWNRAESFVNTCREIVSNCQLWTDAAPPPTHQFIKLWLQVTYEVFAPETKFGSLLPIASTLKAFSALQTMFGNVLWPPGQRTLLVETGQLDFPVVSQRCLNPHLSGVFSSVLFRVMLICLRSQKWPPLQHSRSCSASANWRWSGGGSSCLTFDQKCHALQGKKETGHLVQVE